MKLDGSKVRQARERLGYSMETLGEAAGVAKNSVLRAEHEEDIRPVTARKLAKALGVKVVDLLPLAQAPLPIEELRSSPDEGERRAQLEESLRELAAWSAEARACAARWEDEARRRITKGAFPEWRYKEIAWAAVGVGDCLTEVMDRYIESAGSADPGVLRAAQDAKIEMFDAVERVFGIADAIEEGREPQEARKAAKPHLRLIQDRRPA